MNQTTTQQDLVLTRIFNVPRELVFKCWTGAKHCMQWFGPKDFTIPHCTIDVRVGGKWHLCMRSPEGQDFWCGGVYKEIAPPEHIVCTDYFSNEEGEIVDPKEFGFSSEWPTESIWDITFEETEGGKTKMTLRHVGVSEDLAKGVQEDQGWSQSFDKLDEYLRKL